MAGTRNKTRAAPSADDELSAAAEALLADREPTPPGSDVDNSPPSVESAAVAEADGGDGGDMSSEAETEADAAAEAARLKEENEMLRDQMAALVARVEELSIAAAVVKNPASAEAAVEEEDEEARAEKKLPVDTKKKGPPAKKKGAPSRRVAPAAARKATEAEKTKVSAVPAAPTGAPAHEAEAAGPGPGGRPRRSRKVNSLYPADTWAR